MKMTGFGLLSSSNQQIQMSPKKQQQQQPTTAIGDGRSVISWNVWNRKCRQVKEEEEEIN
jgi:hypothetical protein